MSALVVSCLITSGCVSRATERTHLLAEYKKGLKVGRVIGTDNTLEAMEKQGCKPKTSFSADELINGSAK